MQEMIIRKAQESDVPAITAIYNEAVIGSTATFDLEPVSVEERLVWFSKYGGRYPLIAAEAKASGEVIGWGCLSPYSEKDGYRFTAEHSIYVSPQYQNQGVGKALLQELLNLAQQHGFHSLIARISSENTASLNLHLGFGFVQAGVLREVGYKFDRWIDIVLMQKLL